MPEKIMLTLAIVLFLCMGSCLYADLELSIADTLDFGGISLGATTRVDDTHYVCVTNHCVSLYLVEIGSVSLLDREITVNYLNWGTYAQISSGRLYVMSMLGGVLVYAVSSSELTPLGEISVPQVPGGSRKNVFLKVFGNTMVVGYSVTADSGDTPSQGRFEVYDVSNVNSPLLLASHELQGEANFVIDVHQIGDTYYIVTSNGAVYSTHQLTLFDGVNILPYLPEEDDVINSLVWNDDIYLITDGPFGKSLVRCTLQNGGMLAIDWLASVPFMVMYHCIIEDDRVLMYGIDSNTMNYGVYCYSPADTGWSLQYFRICNGYGGLFRVGQSYLGFGAEVTLYDENLIQIQVVYQGAYTYMQALLDSRYAVLWAGDPGQISLKVYDIVNRAWIYTTDYPTYYLPKRSVNNNQIVFHNYQDYSLLTFGDNGDYTVNNFSFQSQPSSIDVWGDRVLAVYYSDLGIKTFMVYQLQGNNLLEVATGADTLTTARTAFYDSNHFADCGFDAYMNCQMRCFRITTSGGIEELLRIPQQSWDNFFVGQDRLTQIGPGKPVINISDPESPVQVSSLDLPIDASCVVTFDGQDRYLFGPGQDSRCYITDPNFSPIASFPAYDPRYIGRNTMLMTDPNFLMIVQHPEVVANYDPGVPGITGRIGLVYPNPFQNRVSIDLNIKDPSLTRVEVYNIRGQIVSDLYDRVPGKGVLSLNWDGTDGNGTPVSSGIYLIRISAGRKHEVHKAIFLRQ
jgi:hypothetical protein